MAPPAEEVGKTLAMKSLLIIVIISGSFTITSRFAVSTVVPIGATMFLTILLSISYNSYLQAAPEALENVRLVFPVTYEIMLILLECLLYGVRYIPGEKEMEWIIVLESLIISLLIVEIINFFDKNDDLHWSLSIFKFTMNVVVLLCLLVSATIMICLKSFVEIVGLQIIIDVSSASFCAATVIISIIRLIIVILWKPMTKKSIIRKYKTSKQILKWYNELSDVEKMKLIDEISTNDLEGASIIFQNCKDVEITNIEILKKFSTKGHLFHPVLWDKGLAEIYNGKLAVVSTFVNEREQSDDQKETALRAMSSKIACLQKLTEKKHGDCKPIPWILIIDKQQRECIAKFVDILCRDDKLEKSQITLCEFAEKPVFSENGKILMKEKSAIALNNDNCVLTPLTSKLQAMKSQGIKYLHFTTLNNNFSKPGDPECLGFVIDSESDCVHKCVDRTGNDDKNIIGTLNGKIGCYHKQEIPSKLWNKRRDDGSYELGHVYLNDTMMKIEFFERCCEQELKFEKSYERRMVLNEEGESYLSVNPTSVTLKWHMMNSTENVQGKQTLLFVSRDEEESGIDDKDKLSKLHSTWLKKSKINVDLTSGVQIKNGVTYQGENLDAFRDLELSTNDILKYKALNALLSSK